MSDEYSPDFVERNGAWLLSVLGISMTCISGVLVCVLRSRCRTIKCCGLECERDVLDASHVPERETQSKEPISQLFNKRLPRQTSTSSKCVEIDKV